jgi:hypothetical protein
VGNLNPLFKTSLQSKTCTNLPTNIFLVKKDLQHVVKGYYPDNEITKWSQKTLRVKRVTTLKVAEVAAIGWP